jgi:hypothetical protein
LFLQTERMGCIESKSAINELNRRLNKVEAHMNLLDDDIYYIEKRLKRRGKRSHKSVKVTEIDDEYSTDRSNNSNDTTPPETVANESPKTKSGMYAAR